MKTKFKPLDLVENKYTKEVHMVTDNLGNLIQIDGLRWFLPYSIFTAKMSFKKLNPKKVKFNLK